MTIVQSVSRSQGDLVRGDPVGPVFAQIEEMEQVECDVARVFIMPGLVGDADDGYQVGAFGVQPRQGRTAVWEPDGTSLALLDRQLDPARVDPTATGFAARYGLRDKPRYVRYRWLDPTRTTAGHTELTVRVPELAPLDVTGVFVLENETTYLAFPDTTDAIAIFGGGYAVTRLAGLTWLSDRRLLYWGDLDTHGFTILDMLRRQFPDVRSMLMDRATLLAHESQWVREDKPATGHLPLLTPTEAALYQDLVADTFGTAVRLEQERVRYSVITTAVAAI